MPEDILNLNWSLETDLQSVRFCQLCAKQNKKHKQKNEVVAQVYTC